MLFPARDTIRPALFVLAVLCLAPASAASVYTFGAEELTATSAVHAPLDLQASGDGSLVSFMGSAAMTLEGTFGSAHGAYFVRDQYLAGAFPMTDPRQCDPIKTVQGLAGGSTYVCSDRTSIDLVKDGQLGVQFVPDRENFNLEYGVRGYTTDGSYGLLGHLQDLALTNKDNAFLEGGENIEPMEHGDGPQTEENPGDTPFFSTQVVEGPVLLLESTKTGEFEIRGDLVLEILGPTVRLGGEEYATGPTITGGDAEADRFGFVRLHLEDANLVLRSHGDVLHQMAMAQAVVTTQESPLNLHGVRHMDDRIDTEGATLPAPAVVSLYPTSGSAMDGTVDTSANVGEAAAPFYNSDAAQTLFWIVGGILFMMAIVAVVFRQTSSPPLPRIEAALESGEYRKAARLSGRVLRRNPVQESAQLARAIAWSRMGAHDRIVRHLEPFLRRHDPSDGTLHYVYGLALHDAGDVASARAAMAEAVRRTPSLLPDVANELRPETSAEGYW